MEGTKSIVISRLSAEISRLYSADPAEVQHLLFTYLEKYDIVDTASEAEGSDLAEKIDLFIGVRKLDGLSDQTLTTYQDEMKLFSRYISKPVAEISTNDIRSYFAKIQKEKHLEKTTINNKIHIMHSFFGFLYNEDIIASDPSKKLKTQKVDLKSLRESLTIEELETLRNTCRDIREKLVVEFLCSTGCRVSEALNIRVSKIDWTDRSILVHGKGDKDRYVYFSVKCKLLLKQYLAERKGCISDYLFISDRAPYQRLTKSGMEKAIKRIAQRTTITKSVSPHVLRHTFATIALARGMSLELIQQLLGHSNIATTQIYAETSQRVVRAAYEQYIAA